MVPWTWWVGNAQYQERNLHPGKVDYTSCVWSSKTTIRQVHPNANSSLRCSIRMFILPVPSACHFWTKRRTGDQPSRSSRFSLAFRICWMNQMWKILLKPKRILYIVKTVWNTRSVLKPKPGQWHRRSNHILIMKLNTRCGNGVCEFTCLNWFIVFTFNVFFMSKINMIV